jgi:hypothetical protein
MFYILVTLKFNIDQVDHNGMLMVSAGYHVNHKTIHQTVEKLGVEDKLILEMPKIIFKISIRESKRRIPCKRAMSTIRSFTKMLTNLKLKTN